MTSPVRAPRPTPRRGAAPVGRRDHLRIVPSAPDGRRRRRRSPAVLAVAMVLVFGSLLASAVLHGLLVSGQSHLDQVDAEVEATQADLAREKLELANLQSPARIAAEAEDLGMVPASEQIWLSPGTGADPVVTGSAPQATDDEATDGTDTDGTDTDGTVGSTTPGPATTGGEEYAAGTPGAGAQ